MAAMIEPMTLGDIFDRTFALIGRTLLRNVSISVSFLILPIILLTISAHQFYSRLNAFTYGAGAKDFAGLAPMATGGFYMGTAYLLFAVALILAEIAISIVIAGEMKTESVSFPEAVRMTFTGRWLNGIGEGILKVLIFFGLGIFAAIVGGTLQLVFGRGTAMSHLVAGLFTVLLIFLIIAVIFHFVIRLYFALTAVAVQDLGPIEALKESWLIVGGHWWRTLGLLIVFFILSGFAISVVTLPVTFGAMWNTYKEFFTMLGQTGGKISPGQLQHLQTGFGPRIGLVTGLGSLLSLLITPAFTVVMYFDLRARHGDFQAGENATIDQATPPATAL